MHRDARVVTGRSPGGAFQCVTVTARALTRSASCFPADAKDLPFVRADRKQVLRSRACGALRPHPFDPLSLRERGNSVCPSFPLSTFVERGTGGEDYGEGDRG